jgi:hypothetical protein
MAGSGTGVLGYPLTIADTPSTMPITTQHLILLQRQVMG